MAVETMQSETGPQARLEGRVLDALKGILVAPDGPDVVAAGHVYDVVATGGIVRVLLDPDRIAKQGAETLAETVMPIVRDVEGVERVVVKPRPAPPESARLLPGVRDVIAIHSGKGGVGKSTMAVNLAAALTKEMSASGQRLRVGLLDADIYGPSAPDLLGTRVRAKQTADGMAIEPVEAQGLKVMSLGFLMPEGKALAWRGGLVDAGLPQLFTDVAWEELDLLIVDMPPGTSDVHLAAASRISMSGMLTVTSPGQTSVEDVRRGMEMFADLAVPCLGLVENMTGVTCGKCEHIEPMFGAGGGAELASETGLPLLAQLPFLPELEKSAEVGVPVIWSAPHSKGAALVGQLAAAVMGRLHHSRQEKRTC